jgi:hypothetical protein
VRYFVRYFVRAARSWLLYFKIITAGVYILEA